MTQQQAFLEKWDKILTLDKDERNEFYRDVQELVDFYRELGPLSDSNEL